MYMEPQNPIFQNLQSNAGKKNKAGGIPFQTLNQYYKATVIRTSKGCKKAG